MKESRAYETHNHLKVQEEERTDLFESHTRDDGHQTKSITLTNPQSASIPRECMYTYNWLPSVLLWIKTSAKYECKPHCPTGFLIHELYVGRCTVTVWSQTEVHNLINLSPQTSWSLIALQCQSQVEKDCLWWPSRDISFTSPWISCCEHTLIKETHTQGSDIPPKPVYKNWLNRTCISSSQWLMIIYASVFPSENMSMSRIHSQKKWR